MIIIGLLLLLAGLSWLLIYSYAVRVAYRFFARPQPRPPYDKSPLTIDQNTIFGRGQNWFYSNRMNILDWQMTAFDGIKLYAYYIPAAKKATKDVVILVHGFNDAPSVMAAYAQLHLEKRDCHILIPHLRAHGMSEGTFVGYGLYDSQDLVMWMQYLETRLGPDLKIVLHGRSMGAAAVLMTAGSGIAPDTLQGVIADSSFDALDTQIAYLAQRKYRLQLRPFLMLVRYVVLKRFGFPIEKASPVSIASKITVPVLLFHGTDDELVPSYMSDNIYNRLRAPKRICLIEGAAHVKGYDAAPEKYSAEIDRFRDSLTDNEWQRLIGRRSYDD
ncbi:MAG: alpha/beta fold hydrolase [Bacteroidales bacterium]|nr:alpha/beta fold hydrolase [Bacteroidales bacterium]